METPTKIMKNVFFSLAFMLIGSFAFANNGSTNQKLAISNEIENVKSNKIDFETFSKMNNEGHVTKIVIKPKTVLFLDDCGNWWSVTYDGFSSDFAAFLAISQFIYDLTGC
jgi:hypothetical protein